MHEYLHQIQFHDALGRNSATKKQNWNEYVFILYLQYIHSWILTKSLDHIKFQNFYKK